jgi:cytochrome c biogenesis protein CcmG/thiol:disulfide interchange protein DsbE
VTATAPNRPRVARHVLLLATVVAVIAAAVAVLGSGIGGDPTVVPARAVGGPAPALRGTTLDGATFDLAQHRGNIVLVNVWASWCGPCRDEIPLLDAAARRLGPRGLRVVGVDTQDKPQRAREFLAEVAGTVGTVGTVAYPSIDDSAGRVAVDWGTFGVPETFLVDRDGTVRARVVGEVSPRWIDDEVVPLLGP